MVEVDGVGVCDGDAGGVGVQGVEKVVERQRQQSRGDAGEG